MLGLSLYVMPWYGIQNCILFILDTKWIFFTSPDFPNEVQKAEVKIKPRKGRPAKKSQSPVPELDDELKDILTTRWIAKEPIVRDMTSSPPFKAQPRRWLSSLSHDPSCQCPCCSEPCLGRATACWAATQADLILQLNPDEAKVSFKLQLATLDRCKSISTKLGAKLSQLLSQCGPAKSFPKPTLMEDVVGRVYLCMALSGLQPRQSKVCGIWKILEAGMKFVNSSPSPVLRPVRAGLLATKAIMSLVTLAAKKGCSPEELFSNVWTWNPPEAKKQLKSDQKTDPCSSSLKKTKGAAKTPDIPDDKIEKAKKAKAVKPKIQVKSSLTRTKGQLLMTPMTVKSKPSDRELDTFDFNSVVPTFACTPVQKRSAPTTTQKSQRTASNLQFQVYEELSPCQDKIGPVPAAPKRTKKSVFKVGI